MNASSSPPRDRGESLLSNLRLVSLGTLASRVLGLLRDMGMASLFGAGTVHDAFIVAFRIPNLLRQLFGEGALTTAFLPVFLERQRAAGVEGARATLTATWCVLVGVLTSLVVVAELVLAIWLQSSQISSSTRLLLELLVLLLPYTVVICSAALLCAALYALRCFLWPAFTPIVLNAVWLAAVGLIGRCTLSPDAQARSMALTVTLAGILQMAIPAWALHRLGYRWSLDWRSALPETRRVFATMWPVVAGMTILQINTLLDSLLAWALARPDSGGPAWCEYLGVPPLVSSGTATALYMGQRMLQFPLGVFGVALGTVIFPLLTEHAQTEQWDALRRDLLRALRLVIAVSFPASVGLVVLAGPLTEALFQRGQFDAAAAGLTTRVIAIYGAGVWCYITLAILNRAYYALGDRATPVRFGLQSLWVNLILTVILTPFSGGSGLALASVLAALWQVVLTLRALHRRLGSFIDGRLGSIAVRTLAACVVMTLTCLTLAHFWPGPASSTGRVLRLAGLCLAGAASFFTAAVALGIQEAQQLLRRGESLEQS